MRPVMGAPDDTPQIHGLCDTIEQLHSELTAAREQDEWHKTTKRALMDAHEAAIRREAKLREALREGEALLTNYLVAGKFPPGSDCEEVRDIFRVALADGEVSA